MKNFVQLFPTTIYVEDNVLPKKTLKKYEDLILNNTCENGGENWYAKIRNSMSTYNLIHDENFSDLISIVNDRIKKFADTLESKQDYTCTWSWFNVYEKNDYQEIHHHTNCTFSGVFFLKTNENSSPLIVLNPSEHFNGDFEFKTPNDLNIQNYRIFPNQNRLVLFRSYLKHMVPKHESYEKRITIAFNF
jgi:uncharacterized protein (TIGR02466 family)